MRKRDKKPTRPESGGFSKKNPLIEGHGQRGLMDQAMSIVSEAMGQDPKAGPMIVAAEGALKASKRMAREPEVVEFYMKSIGDDELGARLEAVLALSFALTSGVNTEKAARGLEKALMDDDEHVRHMALESIVEFRWLSGNFDEIELLLKVPQLVETVTASLWSASIRLDENQVPAESRRYLRSMMSYQAEMGNRTAKLFLEEARQMAGLD